jgi:hypothetical protein
MLPLTLPLAVAVDNLVMGARSVRVQLQRPLRAPKPTSKPQARYERGFAPSCSLVHCASGCRQLVSACRCAQRVADPFNNLATCRKASLICRTLASRGT